MNIKSRDEILQEIIGKAKTHPKGWNATFGINPVDSSMDTYLFHPKTGIYLLKEYEKNPYVKKGVGAKIARNLDDDIQCNLEKNTGDFGILQGDIRRILYNINRGISPNNILKEAMRGNDLGLKIPVRGQASSALDRFQMLTDTFSSQQKKLKVPYEKLLQEDRILSSYG